VNVGHAGQKSGYMAAAAATSRGVARFMCEHSLGYARSRGYRAMQFNFVVSANERCTAVAVTTF
jgi:hypothetical protein